VREADKFSAARDRVVAAEPPIVPRVPTDLRYVLLIFGLFVLPRLLQRFALPGAITSLGLGFLAAHLEFLPRDHTLGLLATFGIVALFLGAGLEVHLDVLRPAWRPLARQVLVFALLVAVVAWAGAAVLALEPRAAAILALALLTPSAGFILDSLGAFGLGRPEIRRVRASVIVTELFALAALFALTQSSSWTRFTLSSLALVGLVLLIPPVMRLFARYVAPHAPRTEFAFLLMLAVVCAYATRKLGVYYLVGAFLVGVSARRFRDQLPALSSDRLLQTVEEFAIVFGPFYFFHAGGRFTSAHFAPSALVFGLVLALVLLPLRAGLGALLQTRGSGCTWSQRRRIGIALLPTLVFSLVLLGILQERFALEGPLIGGLVVYTLLGTLLPGFLLRRHARASAFEQDAGSGSLAA
jgi:Kef-type K+ transport system membrane component KefB